MISYTLSSSNKSQSNGRYTQRGASAIVMLFYVAIFSLILTCVVKMGPVYIENWSFSSILQQLPEQFDGKSSITKSEIRSALSKRMQIDMIDTVNADDISIERVDDDLFVRADYETRVTLFANIDVVMSFNDEVSLPINR